MSVQGLAEGTSGQVKGAGPDQEAGNLLSVGECS